MRAWFVAACLLCCSVAACAGEAPTVAEAGIDARPTVRDASPPIWPDTAPARDQWPRAADSYAGAPFGCTTDADCFGRRCCETPWGVALCAEHCVQ